jgi:hypothetical protein
VERPLSDSSDPHAWLRPIYARLKEDRAFSQLSPPHQFERLRDAIAAHHPGQAAQMATWSTAAQEALLSHLATMTEHDTPPAAVSVLWTVQKQDQRLRCVAQYLSSGIDMRLLQGNSFVRTQLCRTAREANDLAEQWPAGLLQDGWQKA